MSVIFGYDNPDNLKVSEAVSAKGLNKLQARPSEVVQHAVPLTFQVAYKAYTNFLPAYMRAYVTQKRVDASQSFLPIIFNKEDVFPLPYPNIAIQFSPAPTSEVLERLKAHGVSEVTYQKEKIFIVASPTPEIVQFVMSKNHNQTCSAPQNTVNTSCLSAIMTIRKIFSAFLLTHQYPAFTTEEHAQEVENMRFVTNGIGKRTMASEKSTASKKRKISEKEKEVVEEDEENMDLETDEEDEPEPKSEIRWALPPPPTSSGWGDITSCLSGDGVYAPFIPELAITDSKAVYTTISRYFLSCLGNNTEEVKAGLDHLRSRLAIIAKTPEGTVLAHMACCISLSIDAQAKCFPVIDGGVYQGTALIGARVKYIINKETISPIPFHDLCEKIGSFGSHKSALQAILKLCGVPIEVAEREMEVIKSMQQLRHGLAVHHTSAAARDEIVKLASQLRFGPYLAVNPDTIHEALDLIANPTRPFRNDYPLHHSMLFETDRVALVWSAFGDTAPSPAFPGKKFDLGKNDHPVHIGFKTGVVLREAIADMKHVLSTKLLAVPPLNRRSGPHVARVYQGTDGKRLWADMKSAAGVMIAVAGTSSVPLESSSVAVFADF